MRKLKNGLALVLIVLLGTSMYFTIDSAKNSLSTSTMGQNTMGTPPDMSSSNDNGNTNESSSENNSTSNENSNTPPEKPSGDSNGTPPDMNDNSSSDSSSTPPEKPSGDNNGTPPSMPGSSSGDGQTTSDGNSNNNQMGPGNMPNMSSSSSLSWIYYVLFGVEGLGISLIVIYLIMSKFNKKTFKETFTSADKALIYVLSTIILTGAFTFGEAMVSNKLSDTKSESSVSESSVKASGAVTVDGESKTLSDDYSSSTSDESAILVENGGKLTLKGSTIDKTGDSTNTENSEFYGINSGVLVTKASSATIKNATIKTSAKGSNAVFSTGEDSKIYISDSTITTTGESSSRGLDATYGGYIEADNVNITTKGGSCATLATDRGEGTVIAKNSSLETNGAGSPVIYSTGNISIDKSKGVANGSQMVVIEGKNSATVTNSTLEASGKGNRNEVDNAGIMIYQSMSGDASEGVGTFTAKKSSLSIQSDSSYYKTAPMFFITNTSAEINLEDTKLSYGSGILISAKGTSEWGNSDSNGGEVVLNASKQTLTGDIVLDKISTLDMKLSSSSTYKGTINGDNTAKEIKLTLDKSSKITLTGDSYITSLDDEDEDFNNINFNGYKLYVNGKAIN